MSGINNIHDKFFKQNMTERKTVQSLLENYLPEPVLKLIDLSELEPEKDSMIEEELTDLFSDLIYRVKINNRAAYLYLLFEHKSYPEKKISLQLLKYISYDMHAREGFEPEELLQIASEVSAERGEMIMTIAEKLKKEGIIEGMKEGKIEIARKMLKSGMGIEQVVKFTELTEARIRILQAEIKH